MLLDALIKQRPLRWKGGDGVPTGRHIPVVRQVPHRPDEDVVVREDLGLVIVEVGGLV
jgi:hypothetical protein